MEWEDTKENFVPVKQGHSAAALSTPLSVAKRSRELEEAKRTFLENIKTAEDPLAAWQRYIKWTQEQFAAQGSKSELQQVLELATKTLSSTKRHNNDVRFLRIWVQYADCLPDPSDVFLYLENHGIGRDHALLYEAYATYLELKGNFQQAGLVYQEGINRLAKPVQRLKQKYAAFQQRMEKRVQRQSSEAQLGMDTAAADSSSRATLAPVLAPLGPPQLDENGNPIRPHRHQGQERHARPPPQAGSVAAGIRPAAGSSSRPSLFGSSSSTAAPSAGVGLFAMGQATTSRCVVPPAVPPAPIASTASAAATNGAKLFDVLIDEEFGPSGSGALPTAFPAGHNLLGQLPGYKAGRKENTTDAAQWGGQKLKQQAVYTAPTASKLEVYEDEDLAEQDETAAAQQQQQQPSLRHQLESGSAASSLHREPPAGADHRTLAASKLPGGKPAAQPLPTAAPAASKPASSSSSSSRSSNSSSTASGPVAAAAAAGPQGYDAALLVGPDGSELGFEEVRAVAWRAKRAQQLQQEQEQRKRIKLQQAEEQQRQELLAQQQREQQQRFEQEQQQLERQKLEQERQQLERQRLEQERQQLELQRREQERQKQQLDLERLQLERQKQEQQQQQQQREQQRIKEQQMLLTQQRQQQRPAGYAAEPTVTVNTRAALESMNYMFSQDLPTMTLSRNAMASAAAAGHGYPAARGGKQMGAAGDDPTVTVNTRAALDAMNGMFGCGDDTTTMHGFGGPRGGMARSGRPAAAEPTVTINTRQAFDYMNDMFGDMTGQQTMTGRQMMAPRGVPKGGHSRLSMAAPGAGWQLHEDTELLQNTRNTAANRQAGRPPAGNAAGGQMGWELREDTEFVGNAGRSAGNGVGMGLNICEDTEFLTRPVGAAAAAAGSQFTLYEDTDYLNVPVSNATAGLNRLSLANRSAGVGSSTGSGGQIGLGMGIHEDTDLLTTNTAAGDFSRAAGAGGRPAAAGQRGRRDLGVLGLGLHEDTELLTSNAAATSSKGGGQPGRLGSNRHAAAAHDGLGLGLHEDTELLTGHTAAAARSFGRQSSSSSRASAAAVASRDAENAPMGLQLHEDTELLTGHAPDAAAPAAFGRARSSSGRMFAAHSTDPENMPAGGMGLGLHEDTELLSGPGDLPQSSSFSRNGASTAIQDAATDTTTGLLRIKENLPAAAVPRGPRAPLGSSAATAAGGAAGPRGSRLGYSSAPGSPVGHMGPAWGATTPGKPPLGSTTPSRYACTNATPNRAGPRTPGTPWARQMDDFEVMESPAIREAMAGRPALQMSPAASMPSPGLGHLENLPSDEDGGPHIKPRNVHDKSSRAAALQPLSRARAEMLGVEIDPSEEGDGCDDQGHASSPSGAGPQAARAGSKPSALRSLRFQG